MPTPTVSAPVHFWSGGKCRAAIVLDVLHMQPLAPDLCHLRIFLANQDDAEDLVEHDEAKAENTWHWPDHQPNG